jgi:hypothetical protein
MNAKPSHTLKQKSDNNGSSWCQQDLLTSSLRKQVSALRSKLKYMKVPGRGLQQVDAFVRDAKRSESALIVTASDMDGAAATRAGAASVS